LSETVGEQVSQLRGGGVGLCLSDAPAESWGARGVIEVTGGDAARWLDGMISNDVAALAPGSARSGCYATVLTPKGRIVADVHVLARESGYWLETAASAVDGLMAGLDRYIIADDVSLTNRTDEIARIGLEGPMARSLLAAASGESLEALAPESWVELVIGGVAVVAARFGWSGEDAFQLFASRGGAPAVTEALHGSDDGDALFSLTLAALDVLRIEAGIPLLGAELDEEVFPDEARLDDAISRTKGCYTGQEIVARTHHKGATKRRTLRFESDTPVQAGDKVTLDGRDVGEVLNAAGNDLLAVVPLNKIDEPLSVGDAKLANVALPYLDTTQT
jgi:folate-binding protein YgfZ